VVISRRTFQRFTKLRAVNALIVIRTTLQKAISIDTSRTNTRQQQFAKFRWLSIASIAIKHSHLSISCVNTMPINMLNTSEVSLSHQTNKQTKFEPVQANFSIENQQYAKDKEITAFQIQVR
jgi:hypothetical protein